MWNAWQTGNRPQPWLYVWDGAYPVADDYCWLALIERGKPESIAAQILGEPLPAGLKQKTGALPPRQVRAMLGLANEQTMPDTRGQPHPAYELGLDNELLKMSTRPNAD